MGELNSHRKYPSSAGIAADALVASLTPEPYCTVSEWAQKHRILRAGTTKISGPWRNERTPYLVEIMDTMSSRSNVRETAFLKPAQVGGTEAELNVLGYCIHIMTGSIMLTYPTINAAKDFSKLRVQPMIDSTVILKDKVTEKKSRDSSNTIQLKQFGDNNSLIINGSNSAVSFRGHVAQILLGDEVSAWAKDCQNEGSAVSLQKRAAKTFQDIAKFFYISTPGIKGECDITKMFENSDRRYYHVPCPHCKRKQILVWEQLKWDENNPKTARYECIYCNKGIKNYQKREMLANGEWIASNPENTIRCGYHLNGLYAPVGWISWEDAVTQFLEAKTDMLKMKVFQTQYLSKAWELSGIEIGPDSIKKRNGKSKTGYQSGTIPNGVEILTAGVDVQGMGGGYLAVEIVGWGKRMQSWSILYLEIQGEIDNVEGSAWKALEALLLQDFVTPDGPINISCCFIDSGYSTSNVYDWIAVQDNGGPLCGRVFAIKGRSGWKSHSALSCSTSKLNGLKRQFYNLYVDVLKEQFYGWLKNYRKGARGYCRFPADYDRKYFVRLTSERLVDTVTPQSKKPVRRFEKKDGRDRNEQLDCRVYAMGAAWRLGLNEWTDEQWELGRQWGRELLYPPTSDQKSEMQNDIIQSLEELPSGSELLDY